MATMRKLHCGVEAIGERQEWAESDDETMGGMRTFATYVKFLADCARPDIWSLNTFRTASVSGSVLKKASFPEEFLRILVGTIQATVIL